MINFLVLLLPVVADIFRHFPGGDGERQVDERDASILRHEASFKLAAGGFIIICEHGHLISQVELLFLKISFDVRLDGVSDTVFEESQGLLSLRGDGEMRPVADGLRGDHAGRRQLADHGLQGEEVRLFLLQHEIADLRARHGKVHTIEHVKYDQFIKHQRILYHALPHELIS